MALLEAIAYDFTEDIGTDTVTGVTFAKIHESTAGAIELGKRYLLLVRAVVTSDSLTDGEGVTVKVKQGGSFIAESVYVSNPASTSDYQHYSFMRVISGKSGDAVEIHMANEAAGQVATCQYSSILLLDISNLVDGVNYFYAEDATADDNTTAYQVRATATQVITTQNEGDWIMIGHCRHDAQHQTAGKGIKVKIDTGSIASHPETFQEVEYATEYHSDVLMKRQNFREGDTKTISIQSKDAASNVPQHQYESSAIFGLNLDTISFAHESQSYSAGLTQSSSTGWVSDRTCSVTVDAGTTQDILVIGSFIAVPETAGLSYYGRLRSDNGTGTDFSVMNADQETYTCTTSHADDDRQPVFMFGVANVDGDNGTNTFSLEYKKETGDTYGIDDRCICSFSVGDNAITKERKVWDGSAGDGDLLTAANWTPSGIPKTVDDIIFNTGSVDVSAGSASVRNAYVGGTYAGDITAGATIQSRKIVITSKKASVKCKVEGQAGWINGDYYPCRVLLWDTSSVDDEVAITCESSSDATAYIRNTRGRVTIAGNSWDRVVSFSRRTNDVLITGGAFDVILAGSGYCTSTAAQTNVIVTGDCRYTQVGLIIANAYLWDRGKIVYKPAAGSGGDWYLFSGEFDMSESVNKLTPSDIYLYNATLDTRGGIDALVTPSSSFNLLGSQYKLLMDAGTVITPT